MAKLKLNLTEPAKVVDTKPKVEKEEVKIEQKAFKEKSPVNWSIIGRPDGTVVASSAKGDKFVGTLEEYNKLMRG